jgi:hypothetical protein
MGHVVKFIMGAPQEEKSDVKYEKWTIEENSDGRVHIHLKNTRMDLKIAVYNQFYDVIREAHEKLFST